MSTSDKIENGAITSWYASIFTPQSIVRGTEFTDSKTLDSRSLSPEAEIPEANFTNINEFNVC